MTFIIQRVVTPFILHKFRKVRFLLDGERKVIVMEVIFLLIGLGILVAGGFLVAFIWAMRSGQYDDDYTPSVRILWDDSKKKSKK